MGAGANGKQVSGIACVNVEPERAINTLEQDVVEGLFSKPRNFSPKYFYDKRGSDFFDRICETSEYYLTRAEHDLLKQNADVIVQTALPDHIVEFGNGTSRKTRALLDACERLGIGCTYWAMDICGEMLKECAHELRREYPWLKVNVLVGDYSAGIANIKLPAGRKLAMFLGSTIGNLDQCEAIGFLCEIRRLLGDGNTLLFGADRVKPRELLNAAYNDAQGFTACFNLNVLEVLNRELNADFSLENFTHHAFFNEGKSRMEMHLVSRKRQEISFGALGHSIRMERGETIRTEISRKFEKKDIDSLLGSSDCEVLHHFTSADEGFSLVLARTGAVAPS